jgi:hypothetical protein
MRNNEISDYLMDRSDQYLLLVPSTYYNLGDAPLIIDHTDIKRGYISRYKIKQILEKKNCGLTDDILVPSDEDFHSINYMITILNEKFPHDKCSIRAEICQTVWWSGDLPNACPNIQYLFEIKDIDKHSSDINKRFSDINKHSSDINKKPSILCGVPIRKSINCTII